ncbi:Aminoacyl-tRNA synthetase, class 1a, anticodon-binding [Cynara cardunculus var. scolymus]|uniref:methionine--tRNA ligase n=1 Tax=Cynara cardunculus var. scolymus TaxID=59895 RepID=A0A118K443_CYNCS|nr:Aminoacyl-tRNA synthetase, class 1a, anticodon-binding [Cynara cardunculus var. scolymus]
MAARLQHSLQFQTNSLTTFIFSSSFSNSIQIDFRSKWFSSSSSSKRSAASLYCTCSNTSSSNAFNSAPVTTKDDPFVLTTPLYYVNAPPHMGSAYSTIAADAIARFQRLIGKKVIFITGTDEHGEKIATAAAAGGSLPKGHCDAISQSYRELWKDVNLVTDKSFPCYLTYSWIFIHNLVFCFLTFEFQLDISYDKFIRTTDPKHEAIVEEFYSKVLANGDIYQADYEGLYCVNCEEYKDEKELLENNCCPMHLKPCLKRKEDNYFFALSKYQKKLEEILEHNPDFVQPVYRLNEVQNWMKTGLRDFSISRASVDWGIRVPNDPKQTIYVWFDALLGYISALSEDQDQPSLQTAISSGWPASLHLIGKDGMKMGKSLGNTLEPNELVHRFGPDAVRYFFLREVEFGNDGDYSEERFINIVNAHLANTIGNLLNRTLGLLKKNCQSTLVADSSIAAEGNAFKDSVEKLYESLLLSSACETVLEIGNAGNLYIDEHAPWSLFKQGGTSFDSAAKDLVVVLEAMRIIAIALSPVAPKLCLRIYQQLGYTEEQFNAATWNDTKWGGLKGGQVMALPNPIFAKIEIVSESEDGPVVEKKISKKKQKRPQSTVGA